MKPTTDEVLAWAREAGLGTALTHSQETEYRIYVEGSDWHDEISTVISLAYAAGAAAMKERAAKVCHDKAWELKSRAMKETGRVQRTRLNSEAIGWHDAHGAIRALGDDDDQKK